jgi:hypothetical protein
LQAHLAFFSKADGFCAPNKLAKSQQPKHLKDSQRTTKTQKRIGYFAFRPTAFRIYADT